jgi:site-specific recombinase XerD
MVEGPLDLIRTAKRLPRSLTPAEMRLLVRAAERGLRHAGPDTRYRAMLLHFSVVALFTTGLRVNELIWIRLDDVSLRESAIQTRGKGNRERTVYLPGRQAFTALARFCAARKAIVSPHDALLVSGDGGLVTAQQIRKRLRRLGAVAGTCCVTRPRRNFSKRALIFDLCSVYWATPVFRRRRSTPRSETQGRTRSEVSHVSCAQRR